MIWIWLAIWILGVIGSVVAHEWAHVAVGRRCGWTYTGVIFRPKKFAVGVNLESNGHEDQLWKIAAAGPAMTASLALVFAEIGRAHV